MESIKHPNISTVKHCMPLVCYHHKAQTLYIGDQIRFVCKWCVCGRVSLHLNIVHSGFNSYPYTYCYKYELK